MAYQLSATTTVTEHKVLLIDDDLSLSLVLKPYLQRFGVRLLSANGPEAAAEMLKLEPPSLCLVDLNLGGAIDGYTVVSALRKKFGSALPLLVVSGQRSTTAICRAIEMGADDFLAKPLNPEDLTRKMGRYLWFGRAPPPSLPYLKTPTEGIRASLGMEAQLLKATEFGLYVSIPHFISVGVPVTISCDLLKEALGQSEVSTRVGSCEAVALGSYSVRLIFENLSTELRIAWRRSLYQRMRT